MSLLAVCDACRQPLPKPIYRVGRLRMDTGSRRVYELNRRHRHGERELRLERQEYDLLQTLMRRPGMAFACQVIADNLATDAQDHAALITKLVCTLRGQAAAGIGSHRDGSRSSRLQDRPVSALAGNEPHPRLV